MKAATYRLWKCLSLAKGALKHVLLKPERQPVMYAMSFKEYVLEEIPDTDLIFRISLLLSAMR